MFVVMPAYAQRADSTVAADTTKRGPSPGKAFLRSVLVPGWGQLSVGANKRAAVFIALQSTSYFMLVKTLNKLSDAQERESQFRDVFSDTLRARMQRDTALNRKLSDPDSFRIRVDKDTLVIGAASLVDSRKEQRQDWIAYTLFLTLASGVDAFVAAHLADFPAVITTRPSTPRGGVEFKVTVPLKRP
jgi:hypothetical protein